MHSPSALTEHVSLNLAGIFLLDPVVDLLYFLLLQRLSFSNANVTTDLLLSSIEGEEWFYERIWTPNIFIENELSSQIMDLTRQNFYVSISRLGLVQVSYRYLPNLFDNLPTHLVNFMSSILSIGLPQQCWETTTSSGFPTTFRGLRSYWKAVRTDSILN